MKKIIAVALSILLGSVGYTIVDKTTDERLSTLENQVSSLQEYCSDETITTDTAIRVGDKIPSASNQQNHFTIKQVDYVVYNYDDHPVSARYYTKYYDLFFGNDFYFNYDEILNETEYDVKINDLKVILCDKSQNSVTTPIKQYTTSTYNEYQYSYNVNLSGVTSNSLAGKYIIFRLYFDCLTKDYINQPTVSALIRNDGSFDIDVTLKLSELLSEVLVGNVEICNKSVFIDSEQCHETLTRSDD